MYACAVALGKFPDDVWDDSNFEDLTPTLEAYVWLQGGDPYGSRPSAEGEKPKTEPLHELDLALIKRERARLARLKAEGKL